MKTLNIILFIAFVALWVGCSHQPNESDLYNTDATTPSKFDPVKMNLKPVNEFINPAQNTIAILYLNQTAYNIQLSKNTGLQNGETFALVTWQRKTDPHWFGANIPGKFVSLELVKTALVNGKITGDYHKYNSEILAENTDTTGNATRMSYILAQKPVVMP